MKPDFITNSLNWPAYFQFTAAVEKRTLSTISLSVGKGNGSFKIIVLDDHHRSISDAVRPGLPASLRQLARHVVKGKHRTVCPLPESSEIEKRTVRSSYNDLLKVGSHEAIVLTRDTVCRELCAFQSQGPSGIQ